MYQFTGYVRCGNRVFGFYTRVGSLVEMYRAGVKFLEKWPDGWFNLRRRWNGTYIPDHSPVKHLP